MLFAVIFSFLLRSRKFAFHFVNNYCEQHGLEKLVGEMVNTLVHDRDPYPKIYMIKYLAGQLEEEELS